MLRLVVAAVCLLVAVNGAAVPPSVLNRHRHLNNIFPSGKIVGGAVTTIDKVPHQVALEDSGYLFCGGSIISENYVLTAAHCTDGSSASSISIRSGTDKLQTGGTITQVGAIAQNPGFTFDNLDHDVSVLKLKKPLDLSNKKVQAAISLRTKEAAGGETANVSGWGALNEGDFNLPKNLHSVDVPVVSRADCKDAYGDDEISARMICAGVAGKDSCQGDSGGAITIDGAQVGIVSWGYGCAEEGYPGVYSNVAAAEMSKFIKDNSNNEAQWV